MALANLLGLLGLLSLIGLLIIYIIKPNFQQRFISSTYIWKLSLKYQKRRIPISKLRNLLLILCQILILVSCALILSRPVVRADEQELYEEKIMILDASASMLTTTGATIFNDSGEELDDTRFNRAVTLMKDKVQEVLKDQSGRVSIIVAGKTASLLTYSVTNDEGNLEQVPIQRADYTRLNYVLDALEALRSPTANICTYGNADIDGAMSVAEEILAINSKCEIMLYSDTEYIDKGDITLMYKEIRDAAEWNVAILNGTATINSNSVYTFAVDVAYYGSATTASTGLYVHFRVNNANTTLKDSNGKTFDECIKCDPFTEENPVQHIEFDTWDFYHDEDGNPINSGDSEEDKTGGLGDSVVNYNSVQVYLSLSAEQLQSRIRDDGFESDNEFYFYGGQKPRLRVQYYSSIPNIFVNSIVASWRDSMSDRFEIIPTEANSGNAENKGFDIYIFEHIVPNAIPDDGICILLDPQSAPNNAGFMVGSPQTGNYTFESGDPHPLTKNIVAEDIHVTQYNPLTQVGSSGSGSYEELMFCQGKPVLLFKNQPKQKVLVFSLNLNFATAPLLAGFSYMMTDFFDIMFPKVISEYLYEVGDSTSINSISDTMSLSIPPAGNQAGITEDYDEFPFLVQLDRPGTYSISQYKISGTIRTDFFVKVPEKESNIVLVEDTLTKPFVENKPAPEDLDLLVYFAAALVALLFAEWWLQTRDQF